MTKMPTLSCWVVIALVVRQGEVVEVRPGARGVPVVIAKGWPEVIDFVAARDVHPFVGRDVLLVILADVGVDGVSAPVGIVVIDHGDNGTRGSRF